HLQEILNSILTIPIEAPRPLYSIDSSKLKSLQRQTAMGEWALVLGLALRQTSGRFRPRDGRPRGASAVGDLGFAAAEPAMAAAEVRASASEANSAAYRTQAVAEKPAVAQNTPKQEAPHA